MENKIDVILNFISASFSDAKFEVSHNSLSPTLKHFIIKDSKANKGFGADHSYDIAIHKAYSEFVERKCFKMLNETFKEFKTSNGFSSHFNLIKSELNSKFEVIERDAFLITWHGKRAPYWLNDLEIDKILTGENYLIILNHRHNNLKISLGIVAKTDTVITCIAKVQGSQKGNNFFYIDTKAGTDLFLIMNSLVESISFYSHHLILGHIKHKRRNFQVTTPIDHFYYYMNNNNSTEWFHKGSSSVIELPNFEISTYNVHADKVLGVSKIKRVVTYSESIESQNYYCGKYRNENLNHARFFKVFGNYKINKMVHPLS